MAIAFANSGSIVGTASPLALTIAISVGDLVLVWSVTNTTGATSTISGITDTGGNFYQKFVGNFINTSRVQMDLWVCQNAVATATSLTATYNGTPTHVVLMGVRYTGFVIGGQLVTGTLASSTSLSMSDITQGANSWFAVGFGNQGLGTHAAAVGNLRNSNTSAGTSTTACGLAGMDNTTANQGTTLTVTQTLGTAGIGAFVMLELLPQMVYDGDLVLTDFHPSFDVGATTARMQPEADHSFGYWPFTPPPPPPAPDGTGGTDFLNEHQVASPLSWRNQQEEEQDRVLLPIPPPFIDTVELVGGSEDD